MSAKALPQLERRMLNYVQAAAYLGISKRSMTILAADGEIPKTPIGARVLFDRQDLDAFITRAKASA